MKNKPTTPNIKSLGTVLLAALALALSSATPHAANVWDGGGLNELWTTGDNWDDNAVPAFGNTADITFNTPGAVQMVNAIGSDTTIRSLTLDANAISANVSIRPRASTNVDAAARTLTFEAASGNATITMPAAATAGLLIRGDTVAGGFGGVIQLNSSLAINITNTATLSTLRMTLGQNNDGINANSETVIQGPGGIIKDGAGYMVLAGPNTFGGGLTINGDGGVANGGRVFLENARAAGTGPITMNGTGASLVLGANMAVTNDFVITDNGDQKYLRAFSVGTTMTGNIDIQETTQDNFELQFQTAVTISGNITGTGGAGIRKANNGKLTLTGTNTYTGETTINNGTLALSGSGSIPNTSRISVGNARTFDVSGLSSTFTLGANQTLSGNANGANLVGNIDSGAGSFNFPFNITNTTVIVPNPSFIVKSGTLTMNNNPCNVLVSGAPLTNGTYKLIKADGGTVAGTVASSKVTIQGSGGVVAGSAGYLTIVGGELILNVITQPVLSTSLSGSNLTLSWTGSQFQLEAQTNSITGAWSAYPGSSPVVIPVDPANGSVFLRLKMMNP